MMKHWSIRAQIGLGFSVLLLLLCAVSYQGRRYLLTVVDHSRKSDDMQSMVKALLEARRNEKNLILRKKVEYRDKSLASIAEIKRQAQWDKDHFDDNDNRKMMDDVLASVDSYDAAFQRYAAIALSDGSPADLDTLDKQMVASARTAQELCEFAIKDQKAEMDRSVHAALRSTLIFAALAVPISGLFVFSIVRSVSTSIGKLIGAADIVAEGNLSVRHETAGARRWGCWPKRYKRWPQTLAHLSATLPVLRPMWLYQRTARTPSRSG